VKLSSNNRRDTAGVIVTFAHRENGKRWTLYEPGYKRQALQRIVDQIDATGEPWCLVGYSTPETIVRDLRGRSRRKRQLDAESIALGAIGRMDLAR
jgi:hypothetical protein